MVDEKQKIVVITGPTATGKTSLAVKLAHRFDGEIVSADSMQVYRCMDVGTAKPTVEERQGIPHHLMDVVDPDEAFNAAIFRSLATPIIEDLKERNKTCFLVGGTGLYIKSLLGGLMHCPPSDPLYRVKLQTQYEKNGPRAMHKRLAELDPESAGKIHPNDKVRIIRALEIIH
ncbi:MAG: tRNA (adenosine(37)-N6)-dimethylallyltransferase MiaA, partial [Deltaproteobacteria bacterium]|nr:tRNA (adenosine(37)-N6)-dimethylallyltransferase MiaA [Deltaproteobacteria bacterium]